MMKTAGLRKRVGRWRTPPPSSAANSPDRSATAAPSMTTSTRPRGGNRVSVSGMSTKSLATFSDDSRLWVASRSPVTGLTALQPDPAAKTDTMTSTTIHPARMKTGSGKALPSRSTRSSHPRRAVGDGPFTSVMPEPGF